jgi:hypothetical protein
MGWPTRDRVSGGATLPPAHERRVGAPTYMLWLPKKIIWHRLGSGEHRCPKLQNWFGHREKTTLWRVLWTIGCERKWRDAVFDVGSWNIFKTTLIVPLNHVNRLSKPESRSHSLSPPFYHVRQRHGTRVRTWKIHPSVISLPLLYLKFADKLIIAHIEIQREATRGILETRFLQQAIPDPEI